MTNAELGIRVKEAIFELRANIEQFESKLLPKDSLMQEYELNWASWVTVLIFFEIGKMIIRMSFESESE